jgi:hypothetical protein
MRRAVFAIAVLATIAVVWLVVSFKTHGPHRVAAPAKPPAISRSDGSSGR